MSTLGFVSARMPRRAVAAPEVDTPRRDWLRISARASLAAQLLIGLVSLIGFSREAPAPILAQVLILDSVVQLVEFLFYVVFVSVGALDAKFRYIDWFVTTPTMLFALMALLAYFNGDATTIQGFAATFAAEIAFVVVANALMLLCGIMLEIGAWSAAASLGAGFAMLASVFAVILVRFGSGSAVGTVLSLYTFVVWFLYGVAAMWSPVAKGVAYNTLDIFSKNVFGLITAIYITTL